jgi:hypothetical protein
MSKNNQDIAREIFQKRIEKGLLGPGSDIFVKVEEIENEILSDYPLQRYYTGILYPDKTRSNTQNEADEAEGTALTESQDEEITDDSKQQDEDDNTENQNESSNESNSEIQISQNTFFPTNLGLTFCVAENTNDLEVEFSFGIYKQIEKDIKIKVSESVYSEFINEKTPFPFKDLIKYENGYMFLKRKLQGKSKAPRTEEYQKFDEFKNSDYYKNTDLSHIKYVFHYFEKLIGRTWQRSHKQYKIKLKIQDLVKPEIIYSENLTKTKENLLKIGYTVKTYKISQNPKSVYVKIQLVNCSDKHSENKFSNANELLNPKSIFQSKIIVITNGLKPYQSYTELNPLDKEAEILNYLYKDTHSYGIGHNCSVIWNVNDKQPTEIETTFLPEFDVKDTKNSFEPEDFKGKPTAFETLNNSLDIYDLSHFSKFNKEQIIKKLKEFVNLYGDWIESEMKKISKPSEIEKSIIQNLENNLYRLKDNINYLNNKKIFTAFKLANTAMLIQIILSNDTNFAKKEKELNDLNNNINYKSLEYFRNYDFSKFRPKYRPFQLAFLLLKLNVENQDIGIDSEGKEKEIVDLIWFPTGGGKTEAYLAVSAFTIIYRRLNNDFGYEGTSVIMRYTLRLLTSQQFERASRLIVALEFLRNQIRDLLKSEPITIGMWVGMSSTPNTIKEAEEKVNQINEECNKKSGNPYSKNVFQISSCPWCGTKLISKKEHENFVFGFKIIGKGNNKEFHLHCVNKNCFYHNTLPIQVVDEMLYDNPPTLLFGTVDKFAMLSWQAKGHRFFNSLDDEKLPPDLIIQDELHLLTGPLGSITGIFESVIELLCTKKWRDESGKEFIKKPKIISSTATTRNTDVQIKALYGSNRIVNIFPPSGLSANDSFFAKTSETESKRKYIGFIPTGKSSIDTQLQLIANLFVARYEAYNDLIVNKKDYEIFDKYWTLVSYYNSLKDVGKIHNKVGDEISTFTKSLQIRLFGEDYKNAFNYLYLYNRDKELTSRIPSTEIKQTLKDLEEKKFTEKSIIKQTGKNWYVTDLIDIVLATNMISVGIDIDRFNLMLINGQPRNIAEYIQASSRAGRKYKGLVIDLLDANKARDKSHFEHFIPFHQAFYKSVEPISVTPFTMNTIDKMLASIIVTYIRHKIPGMAPENAAGFFQPEMLDELKSEVKKRFENYSQYISIFENHLQKLSEEWRERIEKQNLKNYTNISDEVKGLLIKPTDKHFNPDNDWAVMQSMREIDTNSFIKIELPKMRNNG